MRYFKCIKCNLVVSDPANFCHNCGAKVVECLDLKVFDSKSEDILNECIKEGFRVASKKLKIDKFDEGDFKRFEYQLIRPI